MMKLDPIVAKTQDFLADQLEIGFKQSLSIKFPRSYFKAKNIIISGMGGSRFPTSIALELFKEKIKVPTYINNEYRLPGYLDKQTLFIAISYSGTTEETIGNLESGLKRRAACTGITVGGELESIFIRNKCPFFKINPEFNPTNQPRMGYGYNLGGLTGILINLKYLDLDPAIFMAALTSLRTTNQKNSAIKLARELYRKDIVLVVAEFLNGFGNGLANQINENAKAQAQFRILPEINHHLMEGLANPPYVKKNQIFVFFHSKHYSPAIQQRFRVTREVIEQNGIQNTWVEIKGKNQVEAVFNALDLGARTSTELSRLYEANPTIIPYVDFFKKRLKELRT